MQTSLRLTKAIDKKLLEQDGLGHLESYVSGFTNTTILIGEDSGLDYIYHIHISETIIYPAAPVYSVGTSESPTGGSTICFDIESGGMPASPSTERRTVYWDRIVMSVLGSDETIEFSIKYKSYDEIADEIIYNMLLLNI